MRNWKILSLVPAFLIAGAGVSGGSASAAPAQPQSQRPEIEMPAAGTRPSFTDRDNVTYTIGPDGKLVGTPAQSVPDAPSFAAFRAWVGKYNAATAQQKPSLEAEGARLATERRAALKELISRDPKRAIELSIGLHERPSLPTSVVQQLEEILQGRGDFGVMSQTTLATVPVPDKPGETQRVVHSSYRRSLTFQGKVYLTSVYGRRTGLLSKTNLPFYGIAVDNLVAMHESPMWVLEAGQALPAGVTPSKDGTKCPVCGQDAAGGIIGIVGSTAYYFDKQEDVSKFREGLWAAELVVGPNEHG